MHHCLTKMWNLLLQLGTKFRNSGQTCVCANRILVQEGILGRIFYYIFVILLPCLVYKDFFCTELAVDCY